MNDSVKARFFGWWLGLIGVTCVTGCMQVAPAATATIGQVALDPTTAQPTPGRATGEATLTLTEIVQTSIPDTSTWATYAIGESGITFGFPRTWNREGQGRLSGADGFVSYAFEPMTRVAMMTRCALPANTQPDRYGTQPIIGDQVVGLGNLKGVVCTVTPSADGREGLLITPERLADPERLLVIRVDRDHFAGVASTLRLAPVATPTPGGSITVSGFYDSPACAEPPQGVGLEERWLMGLRVVEIPVAVEACQPLAHFDGFRRRATVATVDVPAVDPTTVIGPREQVTVGADTIAWEMSPDALDAYGFPTRVRVLRNGEPIDSFAVSPLAPVGPVEGLWAWGERWVLVADGLLIVDGQIQNQAGQYDEIFAWRLFDGHPFFGFQRGASAGFSFRGQDLDLRYDSVVSAQMCCSYAELGLIATQAETRFYALRDGLWWYVRILHES